MRKPNIRLIDLREEYDLTQKDLGDLIGVTQSMIALVESGKRQLRAKHKIKIAQHFNVTVEWLFYEHLLESAPEFTPLYKRRIRKTSQNEKQVVTRPEITSMNPLEHSCLSSQPSIK